MNLSGSPLDFLVAFFAGVLVSFTPCVYPLIPVSAGFVALNAGGSKLKGFLLSFVYVTGVAVTYSILGLVASLTGSIFGQISSHPMVYIIVGAMIILFGFSMLDIFSINLPIFVRRGTVGKHTFISVFVMGLVSGLVVSPCLTPVLGSILAYLATRKQVFYGSALLLIFAYGMGLILILAGTFSSLLTALPKSGKWMVFIKILFAVVLFASGIYFIYTGIRRF
ncbi:MAG: sulfite exporter TauE/SafE family protein [Candidatus Omnitrophica bacterium]|nr:sulfite exporter TauE/SafE family protein [Candidatus Omnitrophota bacterium]